MENEKNVRQVSLQLVQEDFKNDDLNILFFLPVFLRYKYHVLSIMLVCAAAALVYAITARPVYQAEAYIFMPDKSDIEGLNLYETQYTPEMVFRYYLKNFNSRTLRREFFEKNNLLDLLKEGTDTNAESIFNDKFNQSLNYEYADNESKDMQIAKFQGTDAKLSSEWLNKFVDYVNNETVNLIKRDMETLITYKIEQTKSDIESKRNLAKKKIEDEEAALKEAYTIAERLGIKEMTLPKVADAKKNASIYSTNLTMNFQNLPLYTRGTNALSEELNALNSRKDNDPFISDLRDLQSNLGHLEKLLERIPKEKNISAIRIDQYAMVPELQIKPKRKQILILGLFAGLFLGILTALALHAHEKIQKTS